MSDYPHVRAAFINAIAEEGTKAEAIEYLQKQWNEICFLRAEIKRAVDMLPANAACGILRAALNNQQAAQEKP